MSEEALYQAKLHYEEGDYPAALEIINDELDTNPNNPQALFLFGSIMIQTNKRGLAYTALARCAKLAPERSEVWVNYGRCQDDNAEGWAASEWCFRKALQIDPNSRGAMSNLASLEIQRCRPEEGVKWANKCLARYPDYDVALSAKGFAYLMLGKWNKAWKHYHVMVGHRSRPKYTYGDLPEWDGTKDQTVIVHGEQGIGDEIVYASLIPDLARDCKYVVYDCMPRLERLMLRSLPDNVYVHGGRWEKELHLPSHVTPDASITQAGVAQFYRHKDSDFPGTPYLKADPDMRRAMREVLANLGPHPKIGIAWTGGTKTSRCHFRQRTLDDLTSLLRVPGVTWVSLQYKKEARDEIARYEQNRRIKIHHFDWITEAKEYDLTAALVAELDLIIAVPTSVTQLAGGLGKEAWVLVPEITGWLFHRNEYVWAKSVKLFRNAPIPEIAQRLEDWRNARKNPQAAALHGDVFHAQGTQEGKRQVSVS